MAVRARSETAMIPTTETPHDTKTAQVAGPRRRSGRRPRSVDGRSAASTILGASVVHEEAGPALPSDAGEIPPSEIGPDSFLLSAHRSRPSLPASAVSPVGSGHHSPGLDRDRIRRHRVCDRPQHGLRASLKSSMDRSSRRSVPGALEMMTGVTMNWRHVPVMVLLPVAIGATGSSAVEFVLTAMESGTAAVPGSTGPFGANANDGKGAAAIQLERNAARKGAVSLPAVQGSGQGGRPRAVLPFLLWNALQRRRLAAPLRQPGGQGGGRPASACPHLHAGVHGESASPDQRKMPRQRGRPSASCRPEAPVHFKSAPSLAPCQPAAGANPRPETLPFASPAPLDPRPPLPPRVTRRADSGRPRTLRTARPGVLRTPRTNAL